MAEAFAESKYWRRRFSRRQTLAGGVGLAAAALIGCGDSDDNGGGSGGTDGGGDGSPSAGGGGATSGPLALERAPGYPGEEFGVAPINTKERVMGGTLQWYGTTFNRRQNDPDRNNAGGLPEYNNDRLMIPFGGWSTQLVPDMLESFELTDSLSVALKLRPGIKTHNRAPLNGRVFTAEDVAYSINRKAGILDPEAAEAYSRRAQFTGLAKAEAVDDVTVQLTFDSPNGSIMSAFSDQRASMIPMEADDIGWTDPMAIPGTGAWILDEHNEETRATFIANPDYYRTDDEGGRPSFDKLEIAVLPDRAAQIAAFLTGDVDVLSAIKPHEDAQITGAASDALRYTSPSAAWEHFSINPVRVTAFQDKRLLKALQLSIDYEALADPLSNGWLYAGPLHPMYAESYKPEEIKALPGFNPDTKEADIAEAHKLLSAAGHPNGEGLSWVNNQYNTTGNFFDSAVRLQDHWQRTFPGMSIEIAQAPDFAAYTNLKAERDFEGTNYNFAAASDIALEALTYYHTDGGRNYCGYSEAWADDLIEKTFESADSEERSELLKQFMDRYLDEGGPIIPTSVLFTEHAFQPNIGGVDFISGTWTFFYAITTYGGNPRWLWRTA